jgi:hypothetical protein
MPALTQQTIDILTRAHGENWKAPLGPYLQAPAEYGGGWWIQSFVPEPWKTARPAAKPLPPGFVEIFGPEPGPSSDNRGRWLTDLKYFVRAGKPDGFDDAQIATATADLNAWGMGAPAFYEGRYGWRARFPESQLPTFEALPEVAVQLPHLVIAQFQVRLAQAGLKPSKIHAWVPPHLFGGDPIVT